MSSLDSPTIVNMINDALSNSVSIGVGDYYGGGVVGYIFQPGDDEYVAGETHGYIIYYDGTLMEWGCTGIVTNIYDESDGEGVNNTQALVSECLEDNFAAKWCYDLEIGQYDDWFLPNRGELFRVGEHFLHDLSGYPDFTDFYFWVSPK